jgi:hypothetical protein
LQVGEVGSEVVGFVLDYYLGVGLGELGFEYYHEGQFASLELGGV